MHETGRTTQAIRQRSTNADNSAFGDHASHVFQTLPFILHMARTFCDLMAGFWVPSLAWGWFINSVRAWQQSVSIDSGGRADPQRSVTQFKDGETATYLAPRLINISGSLYERYDSSNFENSYQVADISVCYKDVLAWRRL